MSDPYGPPPGMPGPPGPPPSTPPPGWTPQQPGQPGQPGRPGRRRPLWPWLVGVGVLVVLAVVAGGVLLVSGPGEASDARSVQDVADLAVEAAEDLDVDAGVDLLCETPSQEDRDELEELIERAQEEAGTDDPDVTYEVSDVEGDETGTFDVEVTSDEGDLEGRDLELTVEVGQDGDRSCIEGAQSE